MEKKRTLGALLGIGAGLAGAISGCRTPQTSERDFAKLTMKNQTLNVQVHDGDGLTKVVLITPSGEMKTLYRNLYGGRTRFEDSITEPEKGEYQLIARDGDGNLITTNYESDGKELREIPRTKTPWYAPAF